MDETNTFTIEGLFNAKKKCANDRGIDWNFDLDQFKAFWELRNTQRCFYSNANFKLARGNSAEVPLFYPTIERVSQDSPYSPETCVFVTHLANITKAKYVEQKQPMFNVDSTIVKLVNKINKVLANPDCMEDKLKPYREAYNKVVTKNSVLIKKQIQEAELKALEEAEALKWSKEVEWSQYYIDTATEFSSIGVTLKETSGSLRKIVERKHKDDITGEKFNSLKEKKIWVVDKTKPIKQGNIKIVKLSSRNAIDVLTTNTDLGKIALSLHKVVEQVKEK